MVPECDGKDMVRRGVSVGYCSDVRNGDENVHRSLVKKRYDYTNCHEQSAILYSGLPITSMLVPCHHYRDVTPGLRAATYSTFLALRR